MAERTPDPPAVGRYAPADCPHEGFSAIVAVNRLTDSGLFIADITIHCVQCEQPFRFIGGLPAGLRFDTPSVSIDETELHVPIEPEGEKRMRARASYHMPPIPERH
jgi:hypothetical protein